MINQTATMMRERYGDTWYAAYRMMRGYMILRADVVPGGDIHSPGTVLTAWYHVAVSVGDSLRDAVDGKPGEVIHA